MSGHVVTPKVYFAIFGTLLFLTGLTIWVAFQDLGGLNVAIALLIAVTKAVLVVLYFMHLRYSEHLTKVFMGASIFWFLILIGLTMSDYVTRALFKVQGW
jgi:cytochrome c oxidase subunit 4